MKANKREWSALLNGGSRAVRFEDWKAELLSKLRQVLLYGAKRSFESGKGSQLCGKDLIYICYSIKGSDLNFSFFFKSVNIFGFTWTQHDRQSNEYFRSGAF